MQGTLIRGNTVHIAEPGLKNKLDSVKMFTEKHRGKKKLTKN